MCAQWLLLQQVLVLVLEQQVLVLELELELVPTKQVAVQAKLLLVL